MKKRGTMLPPTAETIRITTLASVWACRRVRQAVVSRRASPAAADGGRERRGGEAGQVSRQVDTVHEPGHDEDDAHLHEAAARPGTGTCRATSAPMPAGPASTRSRMPRLALLEQRERAVDGGEQQEQHRHALRRSRPRGSGRGRCRRTSSRSNIASRPSGARRPSASAASASGRSVLERGGQLLLLGLRRAMTSSASRSCATPPSATSGSAAKYARWTRPVEHRRRHGPGRVGQDQQRGRAEAAERAERRAALRAITSPSVGACRRAPAPAHFVGAARTSPTTTRIGSRRERSQQARATPGVRTSSASATRSRRSLSARAREDRGEDQEERPAAAAKLIASAPRSRTERQQHGAEDARGSRAELPARDAEEDPAEPRLAQAQLGQRARRRRPGAGASRRSASRPPPSGPAQLRASAPAARPSAASARRASSLGRRGEGDAAARAPDAERAAGRAPQGSPRRAGGRRRGCRCGRHSSAAWSRSWVASRIGDAARAELAQQLVDLLAGGGSTPDRGLVEQQHRRAGAGWRRRG